MVIGRQLLLSVVLIAGVSATSVLLYTDSEPDIRIPMTAEENTFTELEPPGATPGAVTPSPGLDAFSEVIERPLFSRTRRPQPVGADVPSPAVASNKPIQKDQFLVMGIVITGENKVVLLKPTGKSSDVFRVREGERVLEWTVESVTPETVTIRQGDITDTLKLSDNVLSQAEKRRLVQQRARSAKKDARRAAQKKRIRPPSKRKPPVKAKNGARPVNRRDKIPRPAPRGIPNGAVKKPVR